jgi:hypothetical protein
VSLSWANIARCLKFLVEPMSLSEPKVLTRQGGIVLTESAGPPREGYEQGEHRQAPHPESETEKHQCTMEADGADQP